MSTVEQRIVDLATVDLVGPKGYVHGWKRVYGDVGAVAKHIDRQNALKEQDDWSEANARLTEARKAATPLGKQMKGARSLTKQRMAQADRTNLVGLGSRTFRADEYDKVTPDVFLGGMISDETMLQRLKAEGVTHIINMQRERDDRPLVRGRMKVKWVPIGDDGLPKGRDVWLSVADFAKKAKKENPNAKFYIHCAAGINRGPSAAYTVLRGEGYSPAEAKRLIQRARPVTKYGLAYTKDVERYARFLQMPPTMRSKALAKLPRRPGTVAAPELGLGRRNPVITAPKRNTPDPQQIARELGLARTGGRTTDLAPTAGGAGVTGAHVGPHHWKHGWIPLTPEAMESHLKHVRGWHAPRVRRGEHVAHIQGAAGTKGLQHHEAFIAVRGGKTITNAQDVQLRHLQERHGLVGTQLGRMSPTKMELLHGAEHGLRPGGPRERTPGAVRTSMQRAGKGTAEGLHTGGGTSAMNRLIAQEASIERHLRNESPRREAIPGIPFPGEQAPSRRQRIIGALQDAFNAQPGLKVRRMGTQEALRDGKSPRRVGLLRAPDSQKVRQRHVAEIAAGANPGHQNAELPVAVKDHLRDAHELPNVQTNHAVGVHKAEHAGAPEREGARTAAGLPREPKPEALNQLREAAKEVAGHQSVRPGSGPEFWKNVAGEEPKRKPRWDISAILRGELGRKARGEQAHLDAAKVVEGEPGHVRRFAQQDEKMIQAHLAEAHHRPRVARKAAEAVHAALHRKTPTEAAPAAPNTVRRHLLNRHGINVSNPRAESMHRLDHKARQDQLTHEHLGDNLPGAGERPSVLARAEQAKRDQIRLGLKMNDVMGPQPHNTGPATIRRRGEEAARRKAQSRGERRKGHLAEVGAGSTQKREQHIAQRDIPILLRDHLENQHNARITGQKTGDLFRVHRLDHGLPATKPPGTRTQRRGAAERHMQIAGKGERARSHVARILAIGAGRARDHLQSRHGITAREANVPDAAKLHEELHSVKPKVTTPGGTRRKNHLAAAEADPERHIRDESSRVFNHMLQWHGLKNAQQVDRHDRGHVAFQEAHRKEHGLPSQPADAKTKRRQLLERLGKAGGIGAQLRRHLVLEHGVTDSLRSNAPPKSRLALLHIRLHDENRFYSPGKEHNHANIEEPGAFSGFGRITKAAQPNQGVPARGGAGAATRRQLRLHLMDKHGMGPQEAREMAAEHPEQHAADHQRFGFANARKQGRNPVNHAHATGTLATIRFGERVRRDAAKRRAGEAKAETGARPARAQVGEFHARNVHGMAPGLGQATMDRIHDEDHAEGRAQHQRQLGMQGPFREAEKAAPAPRAPQAAKPAGRDRKKALPVGQGLARQEHLREIAEGIKNTRDRWRQQRAERHAVKAFQRNQPWEKDWHLRDKHGIPASKIPKRLKDRELLHAQEHGEVRPETQFAGPETVQRHLDEANRQGATRHVRGERWQRGKDKLEHLRTGHGVKGPAKLVERDRLHAELHENTARRAARLAREHLQNMRGNRAHAKMRGPDNVVKHLADEHHVEGVKPEDALRMHRNAHGFGTAARQAEQAHVKTVADRGSARLQRHIEQHDWDAAQHLERLHQQQLPAGLDREAAKREHAKAHGFKVPGKATLKRRAAQEKADRRQQHIAASGVGNAAQGHVQRHISDIRRHLENQHGLKLRANAAVRNLLHMHAQEHQAKTPPPPKPVKLVKGVPEELIGKHGRVVGEKGLTADQIVHGTDAGQKEFEANVDAAIASGVKARHRNGNGGIDATERIEFNNGSRYMVRANANNFPRQWGGFGGKKGGKNEGALANERAANILGRVMGIHMSRIAERNFEGNRVNIQELLPGAKDNYSAEVDQKHRATLEHRKIVQFDRIVQNFDRSYGGGMSHNIMDYGGQFPLAVDNGGAFTDHASGYSARKIDPATAAEKKQYHDAINAARDALLPTVGESGLAILHRNVDSKIDQGERW